MEGLQLQSQTNKKGKLYVIGIGPGSVEQLTIASRDAILNSDYIIGNGTYLDQVKELLNGQEIIRSHMGKEVERAKKAVELAADNVVSMVSGGDANVYGMAGLVLEVAEHHELDVDIEVLPGVTAITAGASVLGAPIVNDFAVISLSDLLTPWERIEKRLRAASEADFIISLYNPKSRQRNSNFRRAIEIIQETREGSSPVGLVKNALRGDSQEMKVTTLGKVLDYDDWVDMRTMILITTPESRIWGKKGMEKIITPRGYQRKYDY
ncbi:precorrin-3B C(17)-methyltransferase [Methanohalophilus halophilus]|uniref:Precorrin-3 methyltransferase n=1 Tax=Methanohalophilus halophilus TaxID=2177 RepID=A0A1L3Q2L7_9EURY|nr:precorrin-3B C(17)-methyltransferase [Methanohalophilus halophilus]APH39126.1 precorrin-3B C(17)-methyltransferase [Methanohalophilus halophilus]RNI09818.1 precorrin-3B C(17)-methyltransferase [Methanohalophilus halophilus]SDW58349.1 precorrin-3 methyltransferase [Methanohalophilus halophilus]